MNVYGLIALRSCGLRNPAPLLGTGREIHNSFDQCDEGRNERPKEQEVQDAQTRLSKVELVSADAAEEEGKQTCGGLIFLRGFVGGQAALGTGMRLLVNLRAATRAELIFRKMMIVLFMAFGGMLFR